MEERRVMMVSGLTALLIAIIGLFFWSTQHHTPGAASASMVVAIPQSQVLAARQALTVGTVLHKNDAYRLFVRVNIPASSVSIGSDFADPNVLAQLLSLSPRALTASLSPGDPLTAADLTGLATHGGTFAASVQNGYDAVSIPLTSTLQAVDNRTTAGDRIDIFYSRTDKSNVNSQVVTRHTGLLLHDVLVLAIDHITNTYTLALSRGDAALVQEALVEQWPLTIALRSAHSNPDDGGTVNLKVTDWTR